LSFALVCAAGSVGSTAFAQQPPPPPPGYGVQAPPDGQQPPPPPPGYYGGYGYGPMPMGPKEMDYDEGQPVPPGYHVASRPRKGLIIGGAVTFGSLYVISILTGVLATSVQSAFGNEKTFTPLYIPVAGPFITMGTSHPDGTGVFGLALLGVGQTLGAAMLIGGLASETQKLVRNDVGKPSVRVTPFVAKDSYGLGAIGTF
jgi:hypothetical protein